jgi:hypothetical protein
MACKQTHKKFLLVRQEGKRCISATYVNLVSKLSTVSGKDCQLFWERQICLYVKMLTQATLLCEAMGPSL